MPDALIWGASGGIGRALVNRVKEKEEENWRVFAAARSVERIPQTADVCHAFDASDAYSFRETAMLIAQETEHVDLVVYAAGNLAFEKLDRMGLEAWSSTLDSNLTGAYQAAFHSLNLMPDGGCMVFIGAYLDHVRLPKMGAYAAAKAGLAEMVAVLRRENRRKRFVLVRPGAVDTAFWEQVSFKKPDDIKSPVVVADAILKHYLSDDAGDLDL